MSQMLELNKKNKYKHLVIGIHVKIFQLVPTILLYLLSIGDKLHIYRKHLSIIETVLVLR